MEVLIESLNNLADLVIFGAGHVAQAIAHTMEGTPFKVHLLDERLGSDKKLLSKELPDSAITYKENWEESLKRLTCDLSNTYVVILTHSHVLDEEILAKMIEKDCKYLGMIGSDNKWKRFKNRLLERGISEKDLNRVHCPIGTNIGGKAPKEVAISLASQLLKIYYQ